MDRIQEIKDRVGGDWTGVLTHFGFPPEILDGQHHPCPICEGKDRFRFDRQKQFIFCNQCFKKKCGDGIDAIRWLKGWTVAETLQQLAEHLGIDGNGRVPRRRVPPAPPRGQVVKRYSYQNREKKLLRWKCRTDPKGFFWQAPDGSKKVQGIPETLYRLPELYGRTEIWIVEGEKDTDTLWDLGIPATTNGAAGQWRQAHTDQFLESGCRRAVIIPDQDDIGKEHAEAVAKTLSEREVEVRILTLNTKDVTEWKEAGGEKEDLLERAAMAPVWKTAEKPSRFKPLTFDEVLALKPPTWLLRGLLPVESIIVLWGPPGSGKTFLVIAMALSIAAGHDFAGRKTRQGKVLYAFGEGLGGAGKRFLAWLQSRKDEDATAAALRENLFSAREVPNLLDPNDVKEFITQVPKGTVLIAIDTLARALVGGDENAARDMGLAVKSADVISRETGAAVLLVHHCGWNTDHSRGSTSLPGGIHTELSFCNGCLTTLKQKDLEPAPPLHFQQVPVTVGTDEDGEPITTCRIQLDPLVGFPMDRAAGKILSLLQEDIHRDEWMTRAEIIERIGHMPRKTFHNAMDALKKKGLIQKKGTGYKSAKVP